jgi:hypothetical protein
VAHVVEHSPSIYSRPWVAQKKSNTELPYDPATPFLGILSKELKTGIQADTLYANVYSSIIFNSLSIHQLMNR